MFVPFVCKWRPRQKYYIQEGRTRLPKFKFPAKFPIGLHVILKQHIKKIKICCKIILTGNPPGCSLAHLLK